MFMGGEDRLMFILPSVMVNLLEPPCGWQAVGWPAEEELFTCCMEIRVEVCEF